MLRTLRRCTLFVALCLVVASCGDDPTTPPTNPVSVLSYLSYVNGSEYIAGASLPEPSTGTSLTIVTADTALGRGSTFRFTVGHPAGLREIVVGTKDAVGYFVVRTDSLATETAIRGRLSAGNRHNFTFLLGARSTGGAILTHAQHEMAVLSGEAVLYYITDVIGAEFVDADLPLPTRGVTITQVVADSIIVNGGSMAATVSCTVSASAIIVGIPDARGYFRLPTSGLPGDVSMVILIAQSAPGNFTIQFLSEEPGPEYGVVASFRPVVIHVGAGDVQVSLAFRPSQDLDLHLVEPTGEEIYYADMESDAGGVLDLDSNPACQQDHKNNENITYESGDPPQGQYIVRVDYWESCDGGGADFRVVIGIKGEVSMYNGHFEAWEADGGGQGSGREICRFTY